MAKRTSYHVVPHDDGWAVKKKGAKRATSIHPKKDAAVSEARKIAKHQTPSQVIVHKKDGSIQRVFDSTAPTDVRVRSHRRSTPRSFHSSTLPHYPFMAMRDLDRITFDPHVMGGRACIRGMRLTVSLVVNLLANGMNMQEIIEQYPDLEPEDVRQALRYAAYLAGEHVQPLDLTSA